MDFHSIAATLAASLIRNQGIAEPAEAAEVFWRVYDALAQSADARHQKAMDALPPRDPGQPAVVSDWDPYAQK